MPLRLQVISNNRASLGENHVMEFPARGGTIGRSLDSNWALPDASRRLSGQHAMIDFQAGAYYLVDTSRNGVYINGSDTPVGKGHPQRLFDGDRFRIGDYEIEVALVGDDTISANDTMRDSIVRAQLVPEDESMETPLLEEYKITDEFELAPHLQANDGSAELGAVEERPVPKSAAAKGADKAVAALLESAGLKPQDVAGMPANLVLQTVGQLLRAFVLGLRDLQHMQSNLIQMFDLSRDDNMTGRNNPLRFSGELESTLKYLLGDRSDDYLSAPAGVSDAFRAVNIRQQAMIKAMCHALEDYMTHFHPDALKSQVTGKQKRAATSSGSNKSRYWEIYEKAYGMLTRQNEQQIPRLFSEEFARAYEIELLALKETTAR